MKLAACFSALIAAVVAAPAAHAIDNGVPDGDWHPNVGLLAYDLDGPQGAPPAFLCTGFVVSERVFVTAAHCIDVFPDAQWSVSLEAGASTSPAVTPGVFPDNFPFPVRVRTTPAVHVAVHPRFEPDALAHDVAVLVLPKRTFAGVKPVRLPSTRLVRRHARRGTSLTLVGYGADPDFSGSAPRYVIEGYRQLASAPLQRLTHPWVEIENPAAVTGQGALCFGDSGSPRDHSPCSVASRLRAPPRSRCSHR